MNTYWRMAEKFSEEYHVDSSRMHYGQMRSEQAHQRVSVGLVLESDADVIRSVWIISAVTKEMNGLEIINRETSLEAFLIGKPLNDRSFSMAADAFGNIVEARFEAEALLEMGKTAFLKAIHQLLL